MSMSAFTPESLVTAIKALFESNNYNVEGPLKINGAEVDLRAHSKSDPFAPAIYIEATVEYVNNDKYGKDATKFLLIREIEPNATLMCISASGFSLPVEERAKQSRIEALTYEKLFSRFQRFAGYIDKILGLGEVSQELANLDSIYEEAQFEDTIGNQYATKFLTEWRDDSSPKNPWIVVAGDYGTGKTTLTKILLRRWMLEHQQNPSLPIPFRIELRDFTRQFNARGLLHHFLDTNGLEYLSVDFIFSLIKQGRLILLLDGYDEMAQYMNARERRECLGALAELAKDGTKGILTSRPNYFTEAEELNLLDALYTSLVEEKHLAGIGKSIIEKEKALDKLLQTQFLERYERFLRDLDAAQTKSLIQRALAQDPEGQEVVLRILERTFRSTDEGATVSLSGKPIIISYLLEVVDELKTRVSSTDDSSQRNNFSEWQVYNLIVENLMWRDYRRAPEIVPSSRRGFLRRLSIQMSSSQSVALEEPEFLDLVRKEFLSRLNKLPSELREQEVQKLFADLRSSATLTRRLGGNSVGWRFSHNSLREFLASEYLVTALHKRDSKVRRIRVTDAMKMFVLSLPESDRESLLVALGELIISNSPGEVTGMYINLVWDAGIHLFHSTSDPVNALLTRLSGSAISMGAVVINRISFKYNDISANLAKADFSNASLTDIDFSYSNLTEVDFSGCWIEGVSFKGAKLNGANFQGALLLEVDFTDAELRGADFSKIDDQDGIRTANGVFSGQEAVGYFASKGGKTDKVPAIAICKHHPNYPIAEKIARKLSEQTARQRRGLTQRGVAKKDSIAANEFLRQLIANGLVEDIGGRRNELVQSTERGRRILKAFSEGEGLDSSLYEFFGLKS